MQTFYPFEDQNKTFACLDYKRLGKQRVEGYQILRTLAGSSNGWKSHPAVRMWRCFEPALVDYTLNACKAWSDRGYTDNIADKIFEEFPEWVDADPIVYPSWTRRPDVLNSHKAMLYHKDRVCYSDFAAHAGIVDYVWPV